MELDELKKEWISVSPRLCSAVERDGEVVDIRKLRRAKGAQTRLLRRMAGSLVLTLVALAVLLLFPLGGSDAFPKWWITAFQVLLACAAACATVLVRKIRGVDPASCSQLQVLRTVVGIRRFYAVSDLVLTGVFAVLFVWLSATSFFRSAWELAAVWIFLTATLVAEYIYYRRNVACLDGIIKDCEADNSENNTYK